MLEVPYGGKKKRWKKAVNQPKENITASNFRGHENQKTKKTRSEKKRPGIATKGFQKSISGI